MFDTFTTEKKEWKPSLRQEQILSVPDGVFEKFYGGAAGGGKTEIGICYPLVKKCVYSDRLWYQHPLFKGLVIRRTIPELKKELVKRCYGFYPQTGAIYNKSDRVWTWPWGAQLFLAAAEHEDDIRKYDTEQFNYIFFEELTSFTEFQYIYLAFSRCRPADQDLPACVVSASNPGNIGHGWVRKRFVEPSRDGGKIIKQYFTNADGSFRLNDDGTPKFTKRIFIKALGSDNPYLIKNDPTYLTRIESLPEAEKAAKLHGDWWTFSGQVFDSFRYKRYLDEPDNALHVIEPIEIPTWWPRGIAIDWGFKAATVVYWVAISPEGKAFIYREYYVTETDVAVWATEIGELSRGENLRFLSLDTNAWDSRGEELTIAAQFQARFNEAFGKTNLNAEPASKGRISGKILIQEYLRWRQKPSITVDNNQVYDEEQAFNLKRISEAAYKRYVELFAPPKVEQNIPRLQIFDTCKRLIECIPLCVYDDKNVEDVKEFQVSASQVGDDPYDCLRYLLKRVDRYVKESKNEFVSRADEQKVVEYLQTTGNQTGYYRKMELLEHNNKFSKKGKAIKSVNRILRRGSFVIH